MCLTDRIVTKLAARGVILHHWQLSGLAWMLQCESTGLPFTEGGGILADDPGLGKTYTSLGLLVGDQVVGETTHTLVVVPTSVLHQWVVAGNRLLGEDQVNLYYGKNRQLVANRLVVTSYGVLQRDEELMEVEWDRVILDEVHYVKNYRCQTARRARMLPGSHRWGLTGTPVQNTSEELASLFRFVCGIESGAQHVCVNYQLPDLVARRLLRRTKEEVFSNLAGLEIETTEIDFRTESERTMYETVARNVAQEYQRLLGTPGNHSLEAFELLLRLRQCSQHPGLVWRGLQKKYGISEPDSTLVDLPSSKMLALCQLLSEHPGEPGLVFSPFRQELEMLERTLRERGYQVYRLDGSCSGGSRERMLDRMRDWLRENPNQPLVLLLQSRAGGVGLNLQEFSRVYLMTPDWNPSNDLQAIARAHRLGQQRRVYVKTLVLREPTSIDHRILQVQRKKSDWMASLLGEPGKLDRIRKFRFTDSVWSELLL